MSKVAAPAVNDHVLTIVYWYLWVEDIFVGRILMSDG